MLFAYNSSPALGATAIKLDDHAKSLLQWLELERKVRCGLQHRNVHTDLIRMRGKGHLSSYATALVVLLSKRYVLATIL